MAITKPLATLLWLLLAFASVPTTFALPTDRHATIRIESDRASINDKTGVTLYEGSVIMRQGSIKITADKVTIYSNKGQANRIIFKGSPVNYRQRPESGTGFVIARAKTIEYRLDKDVLLLVDDASLVQEGLALNGSTINYDLKAERVEASGDSSGSQRVRMVIPQSQQKFQSTP